MLCQYSHGLLNQWITFADMTDKIKNCKVYLTVGFKVIKWKKNPSEWNNEFHFLIALVIVVTKRKFLL